MGRKFPVNICNLNLVAMTREIFKIDSSKYKIYLFSRLQMTNIGCACSVGQISEAYNRHAGLLFWYKGMPPENFQIVTLSHYILD